MIFSGVALDILINKQFSDKTHQDFAIYSQRTKKYLKNIENKLEISTINFTKNEKLLSKISFISNYSDPNNYQKNIFDNEKMTLARLIENFSKVTQIDHVRLYNNKGTLIAFSDNQMRNKIYGYLTYESNNPELKTFLPKNKPYYKISIDAPYWKKYLSIDTNTMDGIQYIEDRDGFNLTYTHKLNNFFQDGQVEHIGYIQVTKSIEHNLFNQIAINNKGFNLLISDSSRALGPNPANILPKYLVHSPALFNHDSMDREHFFIINNHLVASHKIRLNDQKNIYLVFGVSRTIINDEINQIRLVILIVFILVTLLSISIAFFYFKKNTGRSIENIIRYADMIKSGHYNSDVPVIPEDELKHLTEVLKLAASTIQDREQQLLNAQSVLENRVKIRTQELQKSKEEADKANAAKSQFLSSMSHELRTPLNAILGFAQLLEMLDTQKTYNSNIQEILQAGYHLLDLVNQILDLSKIESGHLNLNIEPIALKDIIPECTSQIEQSLLKNSNIKIINHISEDETIVLADKVRLRQIFLNLLSNAVKYNRQNGTVTIESCPHDENNVCISITDTGRGIDTHEIDKLFDPFERLNYKHGSIEGSGIGLTVTKELVHAMNGEISVKSIKEEGSRFWFVLPQDMSSSSTIDKPARAIDSSQESSPASKEKQKVLYIEDNPANLKLIEQVLANLENIDMLSAKNAEDGLIVAEKELPELVLMDINLPGMNGFEAFEHLKNNPKTANISVIAVSANAMKNDIEKAKQAGFKDYITKPIDINQFLDTIDKFLTVSL